VKEYGIYLSSKVVSKGGRETPWEDGMAVEMAEWMEMTWLPRKSSGKVENLVAMLVTEQVDLLVAEMRWLTVEGTVVGCELGFLIGCLVDWRLGLREGRITGCFEGYLVGWEVGSLDGLESIRWRGRLSSGLSGELVYPVVVA
jgi:hypothetical protein